MNPVNYQKRVSNYVILTTFTQVTLITYPSNYCCFPKLIDVTKMRKPQIGCSKNYRGTHLTRFQSDTL